MVIVIIYVSNISQYRSITHKLSAQNGLMIKKIPNDQFV